MIPRKGTETPFSFLVIRPLMLIYLLNDSP